MSEPIQTRLFRDGIDLPDAMISYAAEGLKAGELVVFPTETVYGLGANIYDEHAVRGIFRVKGRPADNPLIVHIGSLEDAEPLVMEVPETFRILAKHFYPGPLTAVMKRSAAVLDVVTAGLDTVAIRMPAHDLALRIIREAGVPLAAPSANISGKASPVTADQAYADVAGKVYAVIDGGPCIVGIESTVIELTGERPLLLRPGMISKEDIEEALGVEVDTEAADTEKPRSPGMKYRHYAPDVPLRLLPHARLNSNRVKQLLEEMQSKGLRVALLAPERYRSTNADMFYSFLDGTAVEYARLLYSGLRSVTPGDADIILCLGIEEEGAGLAVMNRLYKSATEVIE